MQRNAMQLMQRNAINANYLKKRMTGFYRCLSELTKNKGALFDRILLVNRIHKRWKENYDETKESFKRNAEGVIIQNNLGKGLRFDRLSPT